MLFSNAVTLRRDKSILYNRVAILILLYSSVLVFGSLDITSLGSGIGLYGGLFQATGITHTFHLFIFVLSAIILQITAFYPRKVWSLEKSGLKDLLYNKSEEFTINKKSEQFKIIEYPLILLFIITGASFLVSTSDMVSIFISIELQSYGLYLLSTLYRNSELATTGGLTYFLLGGLSSCFILLGISLLYANSGTTSLDGIYIITGLSDLTSNHDLIYSYKSSYINSSLLLLSIGFLFKVSAAPFHIWAPNVYDAIPTIVTTFVAIMAKISIFVFLLELVHFTSISLDNYNYSWTYALLLSSFFSLIIGTIVGLTQYRIKRLFTYSTISHVGFILLALSINSIESIQGFIFYLIQYSISNLNAFIILLSIGYSLFYLINDNKQYKALADKNNSPIQLVNQLKGYFYINPILSLSLVITIFSFAGIPPLLGFFAKLMVLSSALDSGYIFLTLVAILTSVISAVYYLNIIKEIFFDLPEHKSNPKVNNTLSPQDSIISLSSYLSITISTLTLVILLFIIMPAEGLDMANILSLTLFNI